MQTFLSRTLQMLLLFVILTLQRSSCIEDGYLRYVKDSCYVKGEALSCMKYRALKIAKNTFFGDLHTNETIRASKMISFVPLDEETIKDSSKYESEELMVKEPRSFLSEWSEFTRYLMKLVKEFFKTKGLKVDLPEGARTIEEPDDDARGKRKKLAVMVPLLNLLATLKTKLLLIPILLAVLLIKKLLLVAALLVPSLLSTLKSCKHHHPMTHYSSYFDGGSSDFNSDYGNSYSYSSGAGYGKDFAANRAYLMPKHRATPAPMYITAPGTTA